MDYFNYRDGKLYAEDVALSEIISTVGTPFYCYSTATFSRHYQVFAEGFSTCDSLICYAVKANSNQAILTLLANLGSGADVVSGGEIRRVRAAGIPAQKIVFSGVGKTAEEMRLALQEGILQFNVESEPELRLLSEVASSMGAEARIAVRVNPDVDAGTHAKISTGKSENKFGIPLAHASAVYDLARSLPGIRVQGVSMHIGSQLTTLAPFIAAYGKVRNFVIELRAAGHEISVIDVGGGLGIPYDMENPPLPADYAVCVKEIFGDMGCKLVFEPGRMIAGNAGVLVSQVLYIKQGDGRQFAIVDAAMNDLLRPSLYDAHHTIWPLEEASEGVEAQSYDIVGPVCESGDVFAKGRKLPALKSGDAIIFRSAGAYGAVMASTYNSRPLIPEVLVNGGEYAMIRPRQSYDELIALDKVPNWLK